jgi:hypothetical protein
LFFCLYACRKTKISHIGIFGSRSAARGGRSDSRSPLQGRADEVQTRNDLRNAAHAKDAAGIKSGISSIDTARKAGQITPDEQAKLATDAYKPEKWNSV